MVAQKEAEEKAWCKEREQKEHEEAVWKEAEEKVWHKQEEVKKCAQGEGKGKGAWHICRA